jgi:hypothetical protein
MKFIISRVLFFLLINTCAAQQNLTPVIWKLAPIFDRDQFGNISRGKHYLDIKFYISSKNKELIVFNYEDIYKSLEGKSNCFKENQSFWNYLNDTISISHMFIENQDSMIISLYENMINPSFIYDIYQISNKKEFDYSLFQLSGHDSIYDRFRYPIPTISIDVCKKSTKIRLIYMQKPNEYMKKLGVNKRIIVSEWFDIADIH